MSSAFISCLDLLTDFGLGELRGQRLVIAMIWMPESNQAFEDKMIVVYL